MALEEDAFLHDHHRRLDVAEDPRGAAQLHTLGAEHVAHHFPVDEDHARADGGVDDSLLADDERVVGDDLALELAVQHDGAAERVLAVDLGRLVDERAEVAAAAGGHLAVLLAEHAPPLWTACYGHRSAWEPRVARSSVAAMCRVVPHSPEATGAEGVEARCSIAGRIRSIPRGW